MSKRRANDREQKKTFMVQSKVTADTLYRLDEIVAKYGFSARYELVQFLISAFLRYADPEHESCLTANDEMLEKIGRKIYAGFDKPENRINLVRKSDVDALTLTDALFIYSNNNGNAGLVKRMKFSDTETLSTCSVNAVLDLIFPKLLPEESDYLKTVAEELDSSSILVALDYLIEADQRCGKYEPANYAANEYGRVPVRKQNRNPF